MQCCCLTSPYSNKGLTLAKYHLIVPEVKVMGCLKWLVCVSSLLLVIQTHSGQIKVLEIYFHTGVMNDTKYANILT